MDTCVRVASWNCGCNTYYAWRYLWGVLGLLRDGQLVSGAFIFNGSISFTRCVLRPRQLFLFWIWFPLLFVFSYDVIWAPLCFIKTHSDTCSARPQSEVSARGPCSSEVKVTFVISTKMRSSICSPRVSYTLIEWMGGKACTCGNTRFPLRRFRW